MKSEFICHHVFSIRSHSILLSFHCHYLRNYIIKSGIQFRFFEWDRSLYQWLTRLTRHHSMASISAYSIFSLSVTIIYLIYFLSFSFRKLCTLLGILHETEENFPRFTLWRSGLDIRNDDPWARIFRIFGRNSREGRRSQIYNNLRIMDYEVEPIAFTLHILKLFTDVLSKTFHALLSRWF